MQEIPLVDLRAQYESIRDEIDAAVRQVIQTGAFILGPEVGALEAAIADYTGTAHAVGVASGTDALILALRALDVGPGDEVILPAFTFFATATAVLHAGARPVLAEVDPQTYCLDPQDTAARITPRTRAIIPVHLYGHPADMDPLMRLAAAHDLAVVEDNAQAIGAAYHGRRTGSFGQAAALSFFPTKNLGAYGDGGMVVTGDPALAEAVRMLRTHGWKRKYYPEMLGSNSRLDTLQAAILGVKLRYLESWNARRRELARRYNEQLAGLPLATPHEAPGARHVYHLYVIRLTEEAPARDRLQAALKRAGIASGVYYPEPLHLTPLLRDRYPPGYRAGDFPVSERLAQSTLALPLYPEMSGADVDRVAQAVRRVCGRISDFELRNSDL